MKTIIAPYRYHVESAGSIESLTESCQILIEDGGTPIGGIAVETWTSEDQDGEHSHAIYYQAFTLPEESI